MKILALVFFLFGIAAAIPYEALERAKNEAILSFLEGMEQAPSLREAMDMDLQELDEVDDGIKSDLVKALQDTLVTLLEKVKDAVDHGKTVKEELKEHVEKVKEELRKLHKKIQEKAKNILERIVEKTKGKFKEWLERLREGWWQESEAYEVAFDESKILRFLKELREKLEEKTLDFKKLIEEVKEKLGEKTILAKVILANLKDETLEYLKHILDILLHRKETRNVKDLYEKMKDYLKELRGDFDHHFSTFLDWLEKVYKSGAEAAKGRIENVKKVALKFLEHVKDVGQKTADEALEFFRPYKKDLGTLWDELEKSIKEAYGKH